MTSPLTIVSGYWIIKNKHDNKYNEWFQNTLSINCPYVFFGTKETIELVKQFRGNLPTYYIESQIEDFFTYKYKDKMVTQPFHCPSVELNLVWHEKLFLMKKAIKKNPFQSDYFMWVDAGICVYRDQKPPTNSFPNIEKLLSLPKDKFIFTSSNTPEFGIFYNENYNICVFNHFICGTSYLFHKDFIDTIIPLYKKKLNIIDQRDIYTDQILLTHLYKDSPELFYKLGDGYGVIVPFLF
jgi:hypothetical protein